MNAITHLDVAWDQVCFPAACACCDGPVAAVVKLPVVRGIDVILGSFTRSLALDLPTCEACHRRLEHQRIGWWLAVVTLCVAVPLVVMRVTSPMAHAHETPLDTASILGSMAWVVGGFWWARNRAGQAFTRRYCPAWIDDATRDLTRLTLGFRRPTLARDVAALSGLAPDEAVLNEAAGYRDAAARVPEAFVPPAPRAVAWWWFALGGVGLIVASGFHHADLAAHERAGATISLHVVLMAAYQLFGKLGVVGLECACGVASIVIGLRQRARERRGDAAE